MKMTYKYQLEPLPYAYNAFEPYIDEQTMIIHHDKHHQAYVDKLNAALDGQEELQKKSLDDLLKDLNSVPEAIRPAVKNNGGGHLNHTFFWSILKKEVKIGDKIAEAINKKFGDFAGFKQAFTAAATGVFGSGWAWLVVSQGELEIITTPNQESPLSLIKKPILTIDLWEHAYYLKYQNRRAEYIEAFFNVINWDKVNENFLATK